MRNIVFFILIISNFSNSYAIGVGFLKNILSPFSKSSDNATKSLPSKAKLIDDYLNNAEAKMSRLDEVKILALSSGGDEGILKTVDDKLIELDFRALDFIETVGDITGRSSVNSSMKALVVAQLNDLSFLLAHLHVIVAKNRVTPHVDKILQIISELDSSLSSYHIVNPSYQTKQALIDFQKIRNKVYLDLVDSH